MIDTDFDGWEDLAVIKKLEQESQLRDDYLEMLVRYMRRQHETGYGELLWDLFKEDYPSSAADLERWLEDRHK